MWQWLKQKLGLDRPRDEEGSDSHAPASIEPIDNKSPDFEVIKLTSGSLDEISGDQILQLKAVDKSLAVFSSLFSKCDENRTLEQWRAFGAELEDNLEKLKQELEAVSSFSHMDGLDSLSEAEGLLKAIRINTRPLIQPAEGCQLIAIVDTETTGLEEFDEPITVAVILAEISTQQGKLVRVVESYYGQRQPSVPIHEGAFQIHGISLADLQGKQFDDERLELLLRSAQLVVAHNAKFDRRMLRHVLLNSDGLPWACSMLALRETWDSRVGQRSLDAICQALGIDRAQPHNALTDAQALLAVLQQHAGKTKRSRTLLKQLMLRPWCPPP